MSDESILEEAQRLVHGDRGENYGHPIEDFTRTGQMWAAILGLEEVTPEQVALCMIAVKISREVNRPKRDNLVDIAGYAETAAMVHEWWAERGRTADTEPPPSAMICTRCFANVGPMDGGQPGRHDSGCPDYRGPADGTDG